MKRKKPRTIVTDCTPNFETLKRAFADGQAGLVECQDRATGKPVALLCAFQRDAEGLIEYVPFARMLEDNPYEQFNPPAPDGGFRTEEVELR